MAISASDVKKLREMTGAGMMDCKKALTETDGDFDAAIDFLRKKGLAQLRRRQEESQQRVLFQHIFQQMIRQLLSSRLTQRQTSLLRTKYLQAMLMLLQSRSMRTIMQTLLLLMQLSQQSSHQRLLKLITRL